MANAAARLAGGAVLAGLVLIPLLFALPQSDHSPPLGNALVAFEPNAGRGPADVDFYARLGGGTIAISPKQTRLAVADGQAVTTRLIGARPAEPRTQRPLKLRVNLYLSRDRSKWRTGLRTYGGISYGSVYPGIDLHYHGRGSRLEYDFVVKPGADPGRIALDIQGSGKLRLDRQGNLVAGPTIRQLRPVAYQEIAGARQRVPARFVLHGNRVSFSVGRYDRSRALVIDPVLAFSDILQAKPGIDYTYDVATDSSGNAFAAGQTWGDGSIPPGDPNRTGNAGWVMRMAPDGSRAWITYIASSLVLKVAVGPTGDPYVAGQGFNGLPVKNAAQPSYGGNGDAMIGRLAGGDGTISWLTYMGGPSYEVTASNFVGIAVDGSGNAYLGTTTGSSGLALGPVYDSTFNSDDGVVVKYNESGSRQLATYLGGTASDYLEAIAVPRNCTSNCKVLVGGTTSSTDFPTLGTDFQHGQQTFAGPPGGFDGFAAQLKADLSARDWATYYGGGGTGDAVTAIAADDLGYSLFAGHLGATTGQATQEVFVHQYTPTMLNGYDRKFGGNGNDDVLDIAYGGSNNYYVAGLTASSDFPVAAALQPQLGGGTDGFVVRFNLNFTAGNPVLWATYLGGGSSDAAYGVAAGLSGDVWVGGNTSSNDFPLAGNQQSGPGATVSRIALDPVVIESGPDPTIRVHDASFTYSSKVPSPSYGCRLSPVETSYTSCPASGKSYSGLADGNYTFSVRVTDLGGSTSRAAERQFAVDTRPIATLTVAPNPALVGRPVTFDASGSSGAGQALAKFEWDLDGDGSFERDTGGSSSTTETFGSPQDHPVSVRVTDAVGASASQTAQLKVNAAAPLGAQFGVTINNGAQFTRTPDVTVTASFPATTTSMLFSNDGGFLAPSVFPPSKTVKWKLDSSGPERLPKQIYVRFLAGTIPSETFQDDIILDETPPVVQQAIVAPAAGASSGVVRAAASKPKWKIRVKARDSNSGVAGIQVTANKKRPGKVLRYKRRLTVKSATRPKWVRARDRAGNYSRWRKAR